MRLRFREVNWRTVKDKTGIRDVLEKCVDERPAVINIREANQKEYQALCLGFCFAKPYDTTLCFADPYYGLVRMDSASWQETDARLWYDRALNSFGRQPPNIAAITGACYAHEDV